MNEQHQQIEWNMTNHAPSPEAIESIEDMRTIFKTTAKFVADHCPDSREKSLAQTNLEQALMWAVAGIARNQGEK
jgi:hypothetical protein